MDSAVREMPSGESAKSFVEGIANEPAANAAPASHLRRLESTTVSDGLSGGFIISPNTRKTKRRFNLRPTEYSIRYKSYEETNERAAHFPLWNSMKPAPLAAMSEPTGYIPRSQSLSRQLTQLNCNHAKSMDSVRNLLPGDSMCEFRAAARPNRLSGGTIGQKARKIRARYNR